MQPTPSNDQLRLACGRAAEAVAASAALRKKHARRKRLNRRDELGPALDSMQAAAKELRRFRGMSLAHEFDNDTDRMLRHAVAELQAERRRLRKMINASPGLPR